MIDSLVEAGNKVLAVTGNLQLYGKKLPTPTWTRLFKFAHKGDTTVDVVINPTSQHGWEIGDEIVFGPTNQNPTEFEKRKIINLTPAGSILTITLDVALSYDHYGDDKITLGSSNAKTIIDASFGGSVDMRAAVGHISRSIKIRGTQEDDWGARILVYWWFNEEALIDKRGYVKL